MTTAEEEYVLIESKGHCLSMTFNRPEKYNAFTPDMYHRLAKALYRLEHDNNLRCGLLLANGEHFSGGLELDQWAPIFASGKMPDLAEDEIDPFGLRGPRLSKPIIMAAQGICYTVGVELMLNTEIRLATPETRFAQVEVKRGIFPCGGATIRLQQEMGWANAQRYLMTGDEFSGAEAYRLSVVQSLHAVDALHQAAWDMAEKVCKAAPLAVQASLRSSRVAHMVGEEEAAKSLFSSLAPVARSDDAKEGVASFLERREAKFTGH